nr:unnamed protein product [Callosobruchus chinensis]
MTKKREHEKESRKKNKGVNVIDPKPNKDDLESSSCNENIAKIKHEVQTVIELMGPTTPHFPYSSLSNTADHETTNETTEYSGSTEEKTDSCKKDCSCSEDPISPEGVCTCMTDATTAPEISTSMEVVRDSDPTAPDSPPKYICPPPFLPANVQFNSECMCPQMASYIHYQEQKTSPGLEYYGSRQGRNMNRSSSRSPKKRCGILRNVFKYLGDNHQRHHQQYYTMNVKHSRINHKPKRLVFELADRSPKSSTRRQRYSPECYERYNTPDSVGGMKDHKNRCNAILTERKSSKNIDSCGDGKDKDLTSPGRKMNEKFICTAENDNVATRMDVYYFDHGDSSFLRTTDNPPIITTEILAEKTEAHTTKFWAEIFGTLHIGISFATSFILQLLRFLLYSIIRPLTVGLIQLVSDYFFKPFLATLFNAVIQPPMIFLYNVATSLRDLLDPIAEGIGYFFREVAQLIRAFRIVEYKKLCRCGDEVCCGCGVQEKCRDRNV